MAQGIVLPYDWHGSILGGGRFFFLLLRSQVTVGSASRACELFALPLFGPAGQRGPTQYRFPSLDSLSSQPWWQQRHIVVDHRHQFHVALNMFGIFLPPLLCHTDVPLVANYIEQINRCRWIEIAGTSDLELHIVH